MIRIPLYADPVNSISYSSLGSEFNNIQSNDRYRGLMESDTLNPIANLSNDINDLYLDGISNQNKIFENNSDLSDNLLYTDAQQLQRLQNLGSLNRDLTGDEKALEEAVGYDLDPNIRNALVQEATRQGDNIYAQESQDFVKQIQNDVAEYNKEVNLYYQGVPAEDRLSYALRGNRGELDELINTQPTTDLYTNEIIKALSEMDKKEKEEIRRTINLRKNIMKQRQGKTAPKKTEEKILNTTSISITPSPNPKPKPKSITPSPNPKPKPKPTVKTEL